MWLVPYILSKYPGSVDEKEILVFISLEEKEHRFKLGQLHLIFTKIHKIHIGGKTKDGFFTKYYWSTDGL